MPDLWLFDDDAPIREHRPDDLGWEVTEERLERKRRSALQALRESRGIEAILSLVPEIRNTRMLGAVASRVLSTDEVHSAVGKALHAGGEDARSPMRWFIQGLLNETRRCRRGCPHGRDPVRQLRETESGLAALPPGTSSPENWSFTRGWAVGERTQALLGTIRFGTARDSIGTEGLAHRRDCAPWCVHERHSGLCVETSRGHERNRFGC